MISPETTPGIYKALPEIIKLEILKEEMFIVYREEKNLEDTIIKFGYNKFDYNKALFHGNTITLTNLKDKLAASYNELSELLVLLDLSESSKLEIYKWAKHTRKELELNDNLLNTFPYFTLYNDKYEKINEQLNKQKSI